MATLRELSSGEVRTLEADHTVGRLPSSSLVIEQGFVSKRHAIVRFTGEHWELRDLGSRNGTFVNGEHVPPGKDVALKKGYTVAFGTGDCRWELNDDSAPVPMVVPLGGGPPASLEGEILALPSSEDPHFTIYRNAEGLWVLEQPESITTIGNQQTFEVGGKVYRFSCPDNLQQTAAADSALELEVRYLQLAFYVSRDEEHVELRASCGTRTFDLGSRTHNYLLLTLARRRKDDAAEGLPEGECGWVYMDDLAHDPSMAPQQLALDVFRIRKQFAAIGLLDPAGIIERRPRTKQLRLGATGISIVTF